MDREQVDEPVLVLKLPAERVAELLAGTDATPFDAGKGRPMKQWVVLNPRNDTQWLALAREALAFVGATHPQPGWDLARTTGQSAAFPAVTAEAALAFTRGKLADIPPDRHPFGPPQPIADDAPAIARLAACLGRDVSAEPRPDGSPA